MSCFSLPNLFIHNHPTESKVSVKMLKRCQIGRYESVGRDYDAHVLDHTLPHKVRISWQGLLTLMCQCALGHIDTEETGECQGNASLFFLGLFTLSFILFIFSHALSGSNNDTKSELRVRGKGVECGDYAVTK